MCTPISVTTGGATGSCIGICRVWPQAIGFVALVGVLVWNFRGSKGQASKRQKKK
jgi:hypothetical protein